MAAAKPILITPDPNVSGKVDKFKKQLHTSRSGFALMALEFILPKIESGELVNMNGKLVPAGDLQPVEPR